ncbi:hypothetical protein D3H35_29645 [Cohnella faecalis]|uniref:Uncharacterized protein n=3 Tax=Cohnella faecalis TaxID=2315694 RepID=A0A398CMQ5_9BACL|nr:hypothetical protein D3H35_29645 [Cohnella faecalis]
MQIVRMFSYREWSDSEDRVLRSIQEEAVPNEEIFLRKLVNATVIRNQLYEHTSNESEEGARHIVYAKPFNENDLELYGAHIKAPLFEQCVRSACIEAEFLYWTETTMFQRRDALAPERELIEISQLLLDHYLILGGRTCETVYSVFDTDMNKVILYLREVED